MIRRNLLLAAVVAALSLAGGNARAAFSITATEVDSGTDSTGISFSTNGLAGPTPTPFPVSYNFLNINYSGITPSTVTSGTISVTTTFNIVNNGATAQVTTTDTFSYTFANGVGQLTATSLPQIVSGAGISFSPTLFASPTLIVGAASQGNLSTMVSSVPEPASMAMLGLGLAGVGLVARRRRLA